MATRGDGKGNTEAKITHANQTALGILSHGAWRWPVAFWKERGWTTGVRIKPSNEVRELWFPGLISSDWRQLSYGVILAIVLKFEEECSHGEAAVGFWVRGDPLKIWWEQLKVLSVCASFNSFWKVSSHVAVLKSSPPGPKNRGRKGFELRKKRLWTIKINVSKCKIKHHLNLSTKKNGNKKIELGQYHI